MTSLPNRCLAAVLLSLLCNALGLSLLTIVVRAPTDLRLVAGLFVIAGAAGVLALLALGPLRSDLALITSLSAGEREASGAEDAKARAPRTAEACALLDSVALLRARSAELEQIEREGRRAIEEAERLRVSFVAAMGHDLRGPLNSVIGFADLLIMEGHDAVAPQQRASVELIRRSAQDLLGLLEQILVWARLEAGLVTFDKRPTKLDDVIADAVRDAVARSGDRNLQVELSIAPDLPPLFADRARLAQALLGLMDQATRSKGQPRVRLSARRAERDARGVERLRIELQDYGLSVREADHDSFFEAFRPSYAPSGRRLAGLGLGPALARALIRAHGGQVWFASKADAGTTFTVELPLTAEHAGSQDAQTGA